MKKLPIHGIAHGKFPLRLDKRSLHLAIWIPAEIQRHSHPGKSTGSSSEESASKHSTSASPASDASRKLPSANQKTPSRPREANSKRVDTGFLCLRRVVPSLSEIGISYRTSQYKIFIRTHSTRIMSRLADDTKIAKGTKRAGEEVRVIVRNGYDLLTQVRRHKDAKEVHSDCKDNDRPEHDSDYKGYQ